MSTTNAISTKPNNAQDTQHKLGVAFSYLERNNERVGIIQIAKAEDCPKQKKFHNFLQILVQAVLHVNLTIAKSFVLCTIYTCNDQLLMKLICIHKGGSRGRVQGVCPPPPKMTYGFLIQLVFCKKKLRGLSVLK